MGEREEGEKEERVREKQKDNIYIFSQMVILA